MASVDDLPADQQAVLRLLLGQGRSYEQIAGQLRMAPAAVRDRAHDALIALGPQDTPLGRERRAQVADYLLSQQSGVEAEAVADLLKSSPSARAWARAVATEVEPLAQEPLPAIPDGDEPAAGAAGAAVDAAGAGGTSAAPSFDPLVDDAPAPARKVSPGLERPPSRRGGMLLLGGAALLAALVIGFFVGRATEDSGGGSSTTPTQTTASTLKVLGQTNLRPPTGTTAKGRLGLAQFVQRTGKGKNSGQRLLNVLAQGLPKAPTGSGYGIWLTKPGTTPVWLGYFQAVTTTGEVGAQSPLNVDPANYDRVILTQQKGREPKTPGTTYLEGPIRLAAG